MKHKKREGGGWGWQIHRVSQRRGFCRVAYGIVPNLYHIDCLRGERVGEKVKFVSCFMFGRVIWFRPADRASYRYPQVGRYMDLELMKKRGDKNKVRKRGGVLVRYRYSIEGYGVWCEASAI